MPALSVLVLGLVCASASADANADTDAPFEERAEAAVQFELPAPDLGVGGARRGRKLDRETLGTAALGAPTTGAAGLGALQALPAQTGDAPVGDAPPPNFDELAVDDPLFAVFGAGGGALVGALVGITIAAAAVGGVVAMLILSPLSWPIAAALATLGLVAATFVPALAGLGGGIGALFGEDDVDFEGMAAVLIFTAATYITVAIVIAVLLIAIAAVVLLVAAVSAGGGSLSGCGSGCGGCGSGCGTPATTATLQSGPVCAECAAMPPYLAVDFLLGGAPSALAIYPTAGAMTGSAIASLAGAAAGGAISYFALLNLGPSVGLPTDSSGFWLAVGVASLGSSLLGALAGAAGGGALGAVAAVAPHQEGEIRGRRADEQEFTTW